MSVRGPHTIDQIARSPEGLLVLIATEDRPYTPEATPALAEELRIKLNTYVYAVKSGQIHERRPGEPTTVVLYTASHPPAEVLQILEVAGQVLAEDGVGVDWRLLEMPERTYVDVLKEMAAGLQQAAPSNWTSLAYYATVIGPRRRDSCVVATPEGDVTLPGGPGPVRAALEELKRLMRTPEKVPGSASSSSSTGRAGSSSAASTTTSSRPVSRCPPTSSPRSCGTSRGRPAACRTGGPTGSASAADGRAERNEQRRPPGFPGDRRALDAGPTAASRRVVARGDEG